MGTKLCTISGYTKEMYNYKAFKKQLKSFLLLYNALYSVEECLFVIYKVQYFI